MIDDELAALTDDERREVIRLCMEVVLNQVHELGLMPLVLIAGDGETTVVLPCGPGADREDVARLLAEAARSLGEVKSGGVRGRTQPEG